MRSETKILVLKPCQEADLNRRHEDFQRWHHYPLNAPWTISGLNHQLSHPLLRKFGVFFAILATTESGFEVDYLPKRAGDPPPGNSRNAQSVGH